MVSVAPEVVSAMVAHARSCAPAEACGLFAGPVDDDGVNRFFPVANAVESPRRFVLDPHGMLNAERRANELGLEVKGVMHSHPTSAAYPSVTDLRDALRFDPLGAWLSVIVSLESDPPVVRCFRMLDGEVTELEMVSD